jgi:ribosomal protein L13E
MHHITPIITKQNGKKSLGKGFSPTELAKAGLTKQDAKKIGIRIDIKRKSAHDENIATLKAHAHDAKPQPKPKSAPAAVAETEKPKKKAKS